MKLIFLTAITLLSMNSFAHDCEVARSTTYSNNFIKHNYQGQEAWVEALETDCIYGRFLRVGTHVKNYGKITNVEFNDGSMVITVNDAIPSNQLREVEQTFSFKDKNFAAMVKKEIEKGAGILLKLRKKEKDELILRSKQGWKIDIFSELSN